MIKLSPSGILTIFALGVGGLWFLQQQKLFAITDPDNLVNQTAGDVYSTVTGSDSEMGADLFDVLHEDGVNPWGWYNPLYYLTEGLDHLSGVK